MKTRTIITGIFISLFTVSMFGQLVFWDSLSRFKSEMKSLESESFSGDECVGPVISAMTCDMSNELILEPNVSIEEWMTVPFESGIEEEELLLEPWMGELFYPVLTLSETKGDC
jgi:hypothetical protein